MRFYRRDGRGRFAGGGGGGGGRKGGKRSGSRRQRRFASVASTGSYVSGRGNRAKITVTTTSRNPYGTQRNYAVSKVRRRGAGVYQAKTRLVGVTRVNSRGRAVAPAASDRHAYRLGTSSAYRGATTAKLGSAGGMTYRYGNGGYRVTVVKRPIKQTVVDGR